MASGERQEVSQRRGELISNCAVVPGAKHYGCIMTQGAPLPAWITINDSGRMAWTEPSSFSFLNNG